MRARSSDGYVPPFLALAGHPVRWRLLVALAESDRRVGELTRVLGQPQALISYHLDRLRSGGLVSSRTSSFDGRAAYYRTHLDRCGELLAATGGALHPGLATGKVTSRARTIVTAQRRATVLFVCTGNGTRSQIAEALLRATASDAVDVFSAGSHPKPIHRNAIRVLAERGIDITDARSKPIDEFSGRHVDFVVSLCDKVREVCPKFPGQRRSMHWSIEDPSRLPGSLGATLPAFRAVAADLEARVGLLVALIDTDSHSEHTRHG